MKKDLSKVKARLLELGFLDNEYLDKYIEVLEANLETNRNRIWTEESRAKLSKSLKSSKAFQMSLCMRNKLNPPGKGLVWVFNGEHLTKVSPGKLSEYFAAGYWLGKTTTIQIRKNSTEIEIHAKEWPKYEIQRWKKGWKLSKRKQNINKEEI